MLGEARAGGAWNIGADEASEVMMCGASELMMDSSSCVQVVDEDNETELSLFTPFTGPPPPPPRPYLAHARPRDYPTLQHRRFGTPEPVQSVYERSAVHDLQRRSTEAE